MWVRGLKHQHKTLRRKERDVASYVGAWIETAVEGHSDVGVASHPMWVRGLKLFWHCPKEKQKRSHPMWVRGLKRQYRPGKHYNLESHPMWVRGLKPRADNWVFTSQGRILCGCVD